MDSLENHDDLKRDFGCALQRVLQECETALCALEESIQRPKDDAQEEHLTQLLVLENLREGLLEKLRDLDLIDPDECQELSQFIEVAQGQLLEQTSCWPVRPARPGHRENPSSYE